MNTIARSGDLYDTETKSCHNLILVRETPECELSLPTRSIHDIARFLLPDIFLATTT